MDQFFTDTRCFWCKDELRALQLIKWERSSWVGYRPAHIDCFEPVVRHHPVRRYDIAPEY